MKTRNPIARVITKITPKVVPDKRDKGRTRQAEQDRKEDPE